MKSERRNSEENKTESLREVAKKVIFSGPASEGLVTKKKIFFKLKKTFPEKNVATKLEVGG